MKFEGITRLAAAATLVLCTGIITPALAEVKELKLANQYSIMHLPLMIMKQEGLVEKRLAEAGLNETQVSWLSLAGSSGMIDGMLSGSLHVASTGTSGFAILWDRTKGKIKSLGGQSTASMQLVTRLPGVESLKDLPSDTKIALPAVGTSPQALALKMYALKKYGKEDVDRFDQMTVTMAHPDAFAAMMSAGSGIDSHFTAPPFGNWELERVEGAKVIFDSNDVTGGPVTNTVLMASSDFYDENPKTASAVALALQDAVDFIVSRPEDAAKIYLAAINDTRSSVDETAAAIADAKMGFQVRPENTVKLLGLMKEVGVIKTAPEDWKDLFFADVHGMDGS